jgi:hypothetical protein
MKKILFVLMFLLIPVSVQAVWIDYNTIEHFPLIMIGGGTYTARYELTNDANVDVPIFVTANLTRFIPFAWNEFTVSASIDGTGLNCQQTSLGYWECLDGVGRYSFPAKSQETLELSLTLHIAASPTNLDYTVQIIGGRMVGGNIAFLCHDSGCDDGIEEELIEWLVGHGWSVTSKAYGEWGDEELDNYDLMVCSDEDACDIVPGSIIYNEHKFQNKGLIEIPSSRFIKAAERFGYTTHPKGFDSPIYNDLFVTQWDPITNGFSGSTKIFNKPGRMTVLTDSRLKSRVIDVSDVFRDFQKTTLFKVDELENQGRYVYVGWFYKSWNWLNNLEPSDLNFDGELILQRALNWAQCGKVDGCAVYGDMDPPVAYNGRPTGIVAFDNIPIYVNSSEEALCKGSIDVDETFDDMDFLFLTTGTGHKYRITTPLDPGNHTIYVRCKDITGNVANESYSWTIDVRIPSSRDIAYLCRYDSCDYGIESDLIDWLRKEGWSVDGKSYLSWTERDFDNYDMIMCSDELQACKVDPGTVVYNLHMMNEKPFVEVGDYRYLSAAKRFGYVSNLYGAVRDEQLYITQRHPITNSFPVEVEAFSGQIGMTVVPDYNLNEEVIDLVDSGDNDYSTLFIVPQSDDRGRFVYVGWFYRSEIDELTVFGETMLRRAINWAHCERVDGCK